MVVRKVCFFAFILSIALFESCDDGVKTNEISGPVNIKFNFYADSVYRYSIKNNIALTQEIDKDNSITINQNMTMASSYSVVSLAPEGKNVSVTYERITMSSGNQLFSLDYDSENDNGTDPMYEDLRNLIDKTFKMTVSEKGDIVSSEPVIVGQGTTNSAYNFNDSSIRKIMLHILQVYPGRDVQPGDIWERTYLTSVGFANVRVKNKYQLVSVIDGIAHIELQGRVTSEKNEQAQNSNMTLNGVQTGSLDIAVNSGLVEHGKILQTLSGDMNITGANTPVTVESNIYIMGVTKKAVELK